MIRLFVDHPLSANKTVPLNEKTHHYLAHVMRCKDGDTVLCFNGQDGEWNSTFQLCGKKKSNLLITKQIRPQQKPCFCALCPAIIKKDNMDFVLQKATELGVTDIYPLVTEHTVHPHFNEAHARLIVQEAAEQCERLTLPKIHTPIKLAQVLTVLPKTCKCFYLAERTDSKNPLPAKGDLAFFIGPEGGWSPKELTFFEKNTFQALHFSVGILRAETASIAILSCWQIGRELYAKK